MIAHFDETEYRLRYENLQSRMAAEELDCYLVFSPENIYYLSGFQTPGYYFTHCLVAWVDAEPTLIVRHFETPNIEKQSWLTSYLGYRDHETIEALLIRTVSARPNSRVGLEGDNWFLPTITWAAVRAGLPSNVRDVGGLVGGLRLIKSKKELELIRAAARYTCEGMSAAFDASSAGVTENDVAGAVYERMIRCGSSYPSLPPFIASGPRSAIPHATWDGRRLEEGDVLFYEVGASADRYGAGLIRIGIVGSEIAPTVQRAFAAVSEALNALIATIRPGATGEEVFRASRAPLEEAGFGDQNRNRAGYSIGLSFPPDWGEGQIYSLREGEHRFLEPGMVFHLVPNILLDGIAGVGLSETIAVSERGCERLTEFPTALVEV